MSHRMMLPDARWFSDRRPPCDIENLMKLKLGAKSDLDYSAKLQQQAMPIFNQTVKKVPVVSVKDDTVGMKTINTGIDAKPVFYQ